MWRGGRAPQDRPGSVRSPSLWSLLGEQCHGAGRERAESGGYPSGGLSKQRLRVRAEPAQGTGGSVCWVWAWNSDLALRPSISQPDFGDVLSSPLGCTNRHTLGFRADGHLKRRKPILPHSIRAQVCLSDEDHGDATAVGRHVPVSGHQHPTPHGLSRSIPGPVMKPELLSQRHLITETGAASDLRWATQDLHWTSQSNNEPRSGVLVKY